MARAIPDIEIDTRRYKDQLKAMDELMMIALPMVTVRKLSDIAARHNKTLAQVFDESITSYLSRLESVTSDIG